MSKFKITVAAVGVAAAPFRVLASNGWGVQINRDWPWEHMSHETIEQVTSQVLGAILDQIGLDRSNAVEDTLAKLKAAYPQVEKPAEVAAAPAAVPEIPAAPLPADTPIDALMQAVMERPLVQQAPAPVVAQAPAPAAVPAKSLFRRGVTTSDGRPWPRRGEKNGDKLKNTLAEVPVKEPKGEVFGSFFCEDGYSIELSYANLADFSTPECAGVYTVRRQTGCTVYFDQAALTQVAKGDVKPLWDMSVNEPKRAKILATLATMIRLQVLDIGVQAMLKRNPTEARLWSVISTWFGQGAHTMPQRIMLGQVVHCGSYLTTNSRNVHKVIVVRHQHKEYQQPQVFWWNGERHLAFLDDHQFDAEAQLHGLQEKLERDLSSTERDVIGYMATANAWQITDRNLHACLHVGELWRKLPIKRAAQMPQLSGPELDAAVFDESRIPVGEVATFTEAVVAKAGTYGIVFAPMPWVGADTDEKHHPIEQQHVGGITLFVFYLPARLTSFQMGRHAFHVGQSIEHICGKEEGLLSQLLTAVGKHVVPKWYACNGRNWRVEDRANLQGLLDWALSLANKN